MTIFDVFDEPIPQESDSDDESACSYTLEEEEEVIKSIWSSISNTPNSTSPHQLNLFFFYNKVTYIKGSIHAPHEPLQLALSPQTN
jgi:hypothetical protein